MLCPVEILMQSSLYRQSQLALCSNQKTSSNKELFKKFSEVSPKNISQLESFNWLALPVVFRKVDKRLSAFSFSNL